MKENIKALVAAIRTPDDLRGTGNCATAEIDPDLFYSDESSDFGIAKRICEQCPVQAQCLTRALQFEEYGVWGGTTPEERAVIRSGGNVISIERVFEQIDRAEYLYSKPAEEIAAETGRDVRTVQRWRAQVHNLGYAG